MHTALRAGQKLLGFICIFKGRKWSIRCKVQDGHQKKAAFSPTPPASRRWSLLGVFQPLWEGATPLPPRPAKNAVGPGCYGHDRSRLQTQRMLAWGQPSTSAHLGLRFGTVWVCAVLQHHQRGSHTAAPKSVGKTPRKADRAAFRLLTCSHSQASSSTSNACNGSEWLASSYLASLFCRNMAYVLLLGQNHQPVKVSPAAWRTVYLFSSSLPFAQNEPTNMCNNCAYLALKGTGFFLCKFLLQLVEFTYTSLTKPTF